MTRGVDLCGDVLGTPPLVAAAGKQTRCAGRAACSVPHRQQFPCRLNIEWTIAARMTQEVANILPRRKSVKRAGPHVRSDLVMHSVGIASAPHRACCTLQQMARPSGHSMHNADRGRVRPRREPAHRGSGSIRRLCRLHRPRRSTRSMSDVPRATFASATRLRRSLPLLACAGRFRLLRCARFPIARCMDSLPTVCIQPVPTLLHRGVSLSYRSTGFGPPVLLISGHRCARRPLATADRRPAVARARRCR